MEEFKKIFFAECAELLSDMEARLMQLQEGSQDKEQLNAIFRCAHSIKGGAGAFGLNGIMEFTHVTEALLDAFREGRLTPDRKSIDTLLSAADIITRMLAEAESGGNPAIDMGLDVMKTMKDIIDGKVNSLPNSAVQAPPEQKEDNKKYKTVFEILFTPNHDYFHSGNEPSLIFRQLQKIGTVETFVDCAQFPAFSEYESQSCYLKWSLYLTTTAKEENVREIFEFSELYATIGISILSREEIAESVAEEGLKTADIIPMHETAATAEAAKPTENKQSTAINPVSSQNSTIRVDLDKVDRLVNMIGELVITEAMLRAQTRDLPIERFTDLLRGIDDLSHHTRELQEAVMAVRMQPVKSVFSRMPRIVRDTSAQLSKNIQLIMSGENTEVDKTVIEQLGDPLTHMIRNSVDHGIETPEKRRELGKPEIGSIYLSAYHQSGKIIIEVSDDGSGINRSRVLEKAKQKGLVATNATLTDEEIDNLIFMPGFSTAEQVTNVSGRGVGMDVVRRNIAALGGTVKISNTPGKGTLFTVSLPLTLAILDGMIVRVGEENYIIPITNIIETVRPQQKDLHHVHGRGDVQNIRGEFIPLVYLHEIFSIRGSVQSAAEGLVILVESGANKIGLVVDELVGQQQVVIKSLEENADHIEGISGATILGDGKVSLILEINELKSHLNRKNYSIAV